MAMRLGKIWDEPHCYLVMSSLGARVLRSTLSLEAAVSEVVDAAAAAQEAHAKSVQDLKMAWGLGDNHYGSGRFAIRTRLINSCDAWPIRNSEFELK